MNTPKVYLLSVGINRYQSEKISNLKGCQKDVLRFQQTLINTGKVSPQNCMQLCDEAATRTGIIAAFRSHFSSLQDGDIALFHFSGHGSREPTPPAFIKAGYGVLGEKNESIVCHDSKSPGVFNIADKELRLLIAEIQQSKKQVSFIGLFDCCHSGSMLREESWNVKKTAPNPLQRPLDKYLEGQFEKMIKETGRIVLPSVNYMALLACSPKQLAYEDQQGGFFTNALIDLLHQNHGQLSYAELHCLSRQIVQERTSGRQQPYLEYWGKVNPYQHFLSSSISPQANWPALHQRGENWILKQGAIYGIERPTPAFPAFDLYLQNDLSHPIGQAKVQKIAVEETIVVPTWINGPPAKTEQVCVALYTQPLTIHLNLKKDARHKPAVTKLLGSSAYARKLLVHPTAKYEMVAEGNQILLYRNHKKQKTLLIGLEEKSAKALDWLNQQLRIINRWENIQQLNPPRQSSIAAEAISFQFSYWDTKGEKTTLEVAPAPLSPHAVQQIELPYHPKNGAIPYQIEVKHSHSYLSGLYFYLVHLDRRYTIRQKHESFSTPLLKGVRKTIYNSRDQNRGLGIYPSTSLSAEDTFILIASETELNSPYSFHQDGIPKEHFGKVIPFQAPQKTKEELPLGNDLKSNWMIKKLTVRLIKQ